MSVSPNYRTLLLTITLLLGLPVSGFCQRGFYHTAEPPLAGTDNEVIQASGQVPVYGPSQSAASQLPIVTVTIVAPSYIQHGKDLDYRLRIENPTAYVANEVQILHPLPKGSKVVKADPQPVSNNGEEAVWNIGTMTAGSRREILLTVTPPADMTEWTHTAKVRFEHTRQAKTKIARPELGLRLLTQKEYQQFDIVTLRLEVTNPGLMEVKDVSVNMQLPDATPIEIEPPMPGRPPTVADPRSRQWNIQRLGPNEVRYFDVRVIAKGLGVHPVIVEAAAGSGAKAVNKTDVTIQAPKLEVTVSAPPQRNANQTAACRISIRNAGPHVMRNVTVMDKLTGGAEIVAASDSGRIFDREAQWILPLLQPGETRTLELTTRNPAGGKSIHSVSATYRGFRQTAETITDFAAVANLRIDFRGQPDGVTVGDTIRFQITIENNGSAAATNVKPTIALAEAISYVSAEPSAQADGNRVVFEAATVPAGAKQSFLVIAKASRAAPGAVTTLELRADVLESGPLRRQETTVIAGGG